MFSQVGAVVVTFLSLTDYLILANVIVSLNMSSLTECTFNLSNWKKIWFWFDSIVKLVMKTLKLHNCLWNFWHEVSIWLWWNFITHCWCHLEQAWDCVMIKCLINEVKYQRKHHGEKYWRTTLNDRILRLKNWKTLKVLNISLWVAGFIFDIKTVSSTWEVCSHTKQVKPKLTRTYSIRLICCVEKIEISKKKMDSILTIKDTREMLKFTAKQACIQV